jgi:rare lipoprotein A
MCCAAGLWMNFSSLTISLLRFPMTKVLSGLMLPVVTVTLVACASSQPLRAKRGDGYPLGYVQRGLASWYGPGFHGNLTANGERYDMHTFTAAHRTLPMGSLVEVRSLTSDRRVKVRINDRGPFVRGRIIDLSYKAAHALGMALKGTDRVEIRVVGYRGRGGTAGFLRIQVGSFAEEDNAAALKAALERQYRHVQVVSVDLFEGRRFRVLVGQFLSEDKADSLALRLANELDVETLVVRDDT